MFIKQYNENESEIEYVKSKKYNKYYIFNNEYYKLKYSNKKIDNNNIYYKDYKQIYSYLNKVKKIENKDKDLIGDKQYEFVEFFISNKNFNTFLKIFDIDYKFKKDSRCYLYSDPDGYLYSIIFKSTDNDKNNLKIKLEFDNYEKIGKLSVDEKEKTKFNEDMEIELNKNNEELYNNYFNN